MQSTTLMGLGTWPGGIWAEVWIMACRYPGVNPLTALPKEGIYKADDTGDFGADNVCSILCFRRSTDGGSLLLKHGAGLGHWYTYLVFD